MINNTHYIFTLLNPNTLYERFRDSSRSCLRGNIKKKKERKSREKKEKKKERQSKERKTEDRRAKERKVTT